MITYCWLDKWRNLRRSSLPLPFFFSFLAFSRRSNLLLPFLAMVRGNKASSDGDNAPPKKMKENWESSTDGDRHLTGLRADGRLPPAVS